MIDIQYPYLPEGRTLKYVNAQDLFMQEAARARAECAGDPLYPVGAVLVKEGRVIARSGNGFNRGPGQVHVCPRIVQECKTGEGYELCSLHDPPGHAEVMALKHAREAGEDPRGADLYLYGHWWACKPCWDAMIESGVRDVYVLDDAHIRFNRDRVYAQTLTPRIKTVSLEGFTEGLLGDVKNVLSELGLDYVSKNGDAHCVLRDHGAECFLGGKSVYTVGLGDSFPRQLYHVFRQL